MKLTDHSLQQLDESYIRSLDEESVKRLCVTVLDDLKEARERLNQNSRNSSRPPSSESLFGAGGKAIEDQVAPDDDAVLEEPEEKQPSPNANLETEEKPAQAAKRKKPGKPGKPKGAPGYGRTQVFEAHETLIHSPSHCAACGQPFTHPGRIYTGFQQLDVEWGDARQPGLHVQVIDHRYEENTCVCGHVTQEWPKTGTVDPLLNGIELSEWRLVGPGLAALIVALRQRFRMSYARIEEFLHDWLGIDLSTGTLSATVMEAGAAIAPVEAELVQAVVASELLHADETPWKEHGAMLWLWVFVTAQVKLYYVAQRGRELLENLLGDDFSGFLMSDGWVAYRHLMKRLRCWAHLLRKAKGLKESYHSQARQFGHLVEDTLKVLMDAVYAAREGPPGVELPIQHASLLAQLQATCEKMRGSRHEKTRALAVEFLNDWEAIFRVLSAPHLPLTNTEAERALRHWVLMRKISHGTRSPEGSRVFALLASLIDTCRLRQQSPWLYLRDAIRARRQGLPLAGLLGGE